MKRRSLLLVPMVLALSAHAALAQDVSTAKALFDKGLADMEAGKLDAACPALGESYRLDPRPGTLFTLAECFAKAGKTASAVARYEDYLNTFARMTPAEQAKQRGRDATARERHDQLKPHMPTLTLRLPDGAPAGTSVIRDGGAMGSAALGVPLPLDPGSHTITTQAPGGPPAVETVTLADDDKKDVTLKVRAPEATAGAPPAGNGQRIAGFVVGGVGVAGLVVGAITGGLTLAKKSTIADNCNLDTRHCNNATGKDAVTSAQTTGNVSTIAFIAGGVALAGGAVILLTAPRSGAPAARVSATWSAGPGGASLGLRGAF